MAGVRCVDLQSRPTELLECTSLTRDAFQQLVPPLEAAFQAHMAVWRLDGHPRTARQCAVSSTCPLPTPDDRLFCLCTSLKTYSLPVVQGRLFGMGQSKADETRRRTGGCIMESLVVRNKAALPMVPLRSGAAGAVGWPISGVNITGVASDRSGTRGRMHTTGVYLRNDLLCGHNCHALLSALLFFRVSPASLLVSIGLGRAHTGSVHEGSDIQGMLAGEGQSRNPLNINNVRMGLARKSITWSARPSRHPGRPGSDVLCKPSGGRHSP